MITHRFLLKGSVHTQNRLTAGKRQLFDPCTKKQQLHCILAPQHTHAHNVHIHKLNEHILKVVHTSEILAFKHGYTEEGKNMDKNIL